MQEELASDSCWPIAKGANNRYFESSCSSVTRAGSPRCGKLVRGSSVLRRQRLIPSQVKFFGRGCHEPAIVDLLHQPIDRVSQATIVAATATKVRDVTNWSNRVCNCQSHFHHAVETGHWRRLPRICTNRTPAKAEAMNLYRGRRRSCCPDGSIAPFLSIVILKTFTNRIDPR